MQLVKPIEYERRYGESPRFTEISDGASPNDTVKLVRVTNVRIHSAQW